MSELDLYDYDLPRERIAQEPLATRSDARLMLVDRAAETIEHYHVRDLPELLRAEDSLVLNNSRVIPAKLVGFRTNTGGRWQGLFLRSDPESGVWEVLTKTRGTLQPGETITIQDRDARPGMLLTVVTRTEDGHLLVTPSLPPDEAFPAGASPDGVSSGDATTDGATGEQDPVPWLLRYGRVPLPPYIRNGQMVDADVDRYQTVYAKQGGSVAAPTAGLHFTESLLKEIRKGQTELFEVTLHVGIGTFRPIEVERLDDHVMHSEYGSIDATTVAAISERRAHGGRCVAVGTTSVRVLESACAAAGGTLSPFSGATDLFIRPPFEFKAVDALMTNFHLPKSSLLVLVSALAGRDLILRAYREAVEQQYRFFSYGDAMLIV